MQVMSGSKTPQRFRSFIAGWVKLFRANRGISQEELAEHLQCSSRQIQKVEEGQSTPSSLWVSKLSAAMKEDMRQRFLNELAALAEHEMHIKPLRRGDTSL